MEFFLEFFGFFFWNFFGMFGIFWNSNEIPKTPHCRNEGGGLNHLSCPTAGLTLEAGGAGGSAVLVIPGKPSVTRARTRIIHNNKRNRWCRTRRQVDRTNKPSVIPDGLHMIIATPHTTMQLHTRPSPSMDLGQGSRRGAKSQVSKKAVAYCIAVGLSYQDEKWRLGLCPHAAPTRPRWEQCQA